MRLGYRLEVLLPLTALLVFGWIVASLVLVRWLAAELEQATIQQAGSLARNLAKWSAEAALTEDRVDLLRLVTETRESNPEVVYVFVHDPSGRILAHSFDHAFPSALGQAVAGRDETRLETEEGPVLDFRAGILRGEGGDVHVGHSRRRMLASVDRLKTLIWIIAVPVLVLGLVAVSILSLYLTRPAVKLTGVVRRFGSGDLSARVRERFGGDIGTLADAFNTMAANLERQSNQLRYLTSYNQTLIDNLGAGLYVVDSHLRIEYANKEIVNEVGEVEGRTCHEVLGCQPTPCEECVAERARREGRVMTRTYCLPDGRWLEQTAIPIRESDGKSSTIVTRRDITEAVRLREQITQHEKLAAVGELAAVVAHEVNNPLDGMQSLVRLVVDDPATPAEARRHLEMVQEGLHRIEMIVRRLLTFTTDAEEPSQLGSLESEVQRALVFVQKRFQAAGVAVTTEFERGLPMVRISPNRFPQLVVNLLLNAADVMPDGGALAVRTARSNGGVRLAFEDDGPGVPPESRERIFQPFYTTKDPGKGTGLGLTVSRRIAEEHGGRLTVRDAEGGGAAFDLWLPLPGAER